MPHPAAEARVPRPPQHGGARIDADYHECCISIVTKDRDYFQDEPGLVARPIKLIEKDMTKEIIHERARNETTSMITVYTEFKLEVTNMSSAPERLMRCSELTPHPNQPQLPPRHQRSAQAEVRGELGEGEVEGEVTQLVNS